MSIKRKFGIRVLFATVLVLALSAGTALAQSAVHGMGTTGTIPVWTNNSSTIGNGLLTQSGGNVTNASGNVAAKQLISTVPIGMPPLIVTSTTLVPNLNASSLGGFGSDGFVHNSISPQQTGAFNLSGNGTLGGTLNAGIVNVVGLYQIAGTPVLKVDATSFDVFVGNGAGLANITGAHNTAVGFQALGSNVSGLNNTALGYNALLSNNISAKTGNDNTAVGSGALFLNDTGDANTAIGSGALQDNTVGFNNTAIGLGALTANTDGSNNVAVGFDALNVNTMTAGTGLGTQNTAIGADALANNTTGSNNTAIGHAALQLNTTGNSNTAVGDSAGSQLLTGSANILLGFGAGDNFTSNEDSNIDIGSGGIAGDSHIMRLGNPGLDATYIGGITGVTTGLAAVPVLIDGNGQLGTMSSSRRYKQDIQDMGAASDGLLRLRPVTFRYKKAYDDGSKPIQYGLVAEEVAEVYPDLVVRGKDGQVETVQYYKLDAMLLNEIQKLAKAHAADQAEIAELRSQVAEQLKQGQEQQAAMRQLLTQVRVIQATLATGSAPKATTLEVAAKY